MFKGCFQNLIVTFRMCIHLFCEVIIDLFVLMSFILTVSLKYMRGL